MVVFSTLKKIFINLNPQKEREWILLENGFTDVKDKKGNIIYRYKSCIDTFPYTFEFEGKTVTVQLTEKRLLTYNPKLATKKRYEINRLVEKARSPAMSQAKKSQFGESGKYVNFTDKDGKKAVVGINEKAIEKDLRFAGYNLLVTSETKMKDEEMYQIYHNLQCQFACSFVNYCLSRTHRIYLTPIYMHQTIPAKRQHPIKSQNTDVQLKLSAISPRPYELIVLPT